MAGYSKSVISKIVANNAISASYALSSSYAQNASNGKGTFSGSFTGSFTGNLLGTASQALTASYVPLLAGPNITINYQSNGIAITGSSAGVGTPGGSNTQIQFNSASVFSGSSNLAFDYTNNNLLLTGSFTLNQTLTYFSSVTSSVSGDNNLFILNTGSYTSAFGKYTLDTIKNTPDTKFITVFGRQIRHKMSEGFPLLTTKKMHWKSIVTELLWFLRGDTNIKYLVGNDCHIWDGDAYKNYLKTYPDWYSEQHIIAHQKITQEEFINKIKTDDKFAKKWGDLGPIYGKQWRSWTKFEDESKEHNEWYISSESRFTIT